MTATTDLDLDAPAQDGALAEPIAIIGMACRVPGATDTERFWDNLVNGVESIRRFTVEEQIEIGVNRRAAEDPNFVAAAPVLDDYDSLDAALFRMTPREAEIKDPQQRLFLELSHSALEDAGYDPARYPGEIGVYGGVGADEYQWKNIHRNPPAQRAAGSLSIATSNHSDYLATYVSYKLNLRGPSLTVHTACSTSLVAVHLACESLRNGECEMALSGAASIEMPHGAGYLYSEGSILSPDGHCRAFDAASAGTIWGSGGGVVVLKRLADALQDGDSIRAVIRGNAINNDGADKVGFSAPSVEGQAAVVAQALGVGGVAPETVTYVEAHGTGTALGDPIEVAALTSVFAQGSAETGWCALGSLKTNIGHLGPAAGVAALVKVVLSLEHGVIPPSLHFDQPHPQIDFAASPFYVNDSLSSWPTDRGPRRAGLSSFGIGGTNAHLVLEEAPQHMVAPPDAQPTGPQILQVSARTELARDAMVERLRARLEADPELSLADVAATLRHGRAAHPLRAAVVANDAADAAAAWTDKRRRKEGKATDPAPQVAMLFSGQGAQFAGMGAALYATESAYRAAVDECAEIVAAETGRDLRPLLHAGPSEAEAANADLARTEFTQPALFTVEYALAALWRSWGVVPQAMIGHSIGEFVAATLAGVFSLQDALRLVVARGALMQSMPAGSMLAVQSDAEDLRGKLPPEITLATVNGPRTCVVAGPTAAIADFTEKLAADGIGAKELRTSHAFHSPMMEPILAPFRDRVAELELRAPSVPFLSNVTGTWITDADAVDPSYWTRHLRETVRFGECLSTLLTSGSWALLEVGPGRQLMGAARMQTRGTQTLLLRSLPGPSDRETDSDTIYGAAAELWVAGVPVDTGAQTPIRRRVRLPGYAYQRKRFWIDPITDAAVYEDQDEAATLPLDQWFAVPVWRQLVPSAEREELGRCLVLVDGPRGEAVADGLHARGADVVRVRPGSTYGREDCVVTVSAADHRGDLDRLLAELAEDGGIPERIVHTLCLDLPPAEGDLDKVWAAQEPGFFSLLSLAQALASAQRPERIRLDVITTETVDVRGDDLRRPESASVAGPVRVLPLELPWLKARQIDVGPTDDEAVADAIADPGTACLAVRGGRWWTEDWASTPLTGEASLTVPIRTEGVYLVTGGLGGIGITVAEDLATRDRARLVLLARSPMPPREAWDSHLAVNGTSDRIGRAIAAIYRMEKAGGEVVVFAGDVADMTDMTALRALVLERFGRLDGIVHAAGIPGGGMAEVKDAAAAAAVMSPKIRGTAVLATVFGALPMDFVVLCSSVTSVAGGFGQVDYCGANAYLDAVSRAPHGFSAPVISINWGGWLEVGMAAEVEAPKAFRALQRGVTSVPIDHPVLTSANVATEESAFWCSGLVSPRTHWLLDEHRINGHAVVPGTGLLETVRAAAAAATEHGEQALLQLEDVVFLAPLAVLDEGQAEVRVAFAEGAEGLDFQVTSRIGGQEQVHARGSLRWVPVEDDQMHDLDAIRSRCSLKVVETADLGSHSGMLTFGPRWSSLQRVHLGVDEEIALLQAGPDVATDSSEWFLHPALLDEATSFGMSRGSGRYLPISYGALLVRDRLPATLWSHLRYRDGESDEIIVADLSLLDSQGREVVAISDFMLRRVDADSVGAGLTEQTSAEVEEPLRLSDARGIVPADGAEALRRILAHRAGPQVAVTVSDVRRVIAGARELTQQSVAEQLVEGAGTDAAERELDSDYIAPRNELEGRICALWEAVLGVGKVGVDDDFFDLGGNSLVAVQLISQIRDALGEKLPMRTLFEAPTVGGMAATIERMRTDASTAAPATAQSRPDPVVDEMTITRQPRGVSAMSEGGARG